jgi:hypothetical protein
LLPLKLEKSMSDEYINKMGIDKTISEMRNMVPNKLF